MQPNHILRQFDYIHGSRLISFEAFLFLFEAFLPIVTVAKTFLPLSFQRPAPFCIYILHYLLACELSSAALVYDDAGSSVLRKCCKQKQAADTMWRCRAFHCGGGSRRPLWRWYGCSGSTAMTRNSRIKLLSDTLILGSRARELCRSLSSYVHTSPAWVAQRLLCGVGMGR